MNGSDGSERLLPCPFCGGTATWYYSSNLVAVTIQCDNDDCPAICRVHRRSFDEAQMYWNRRAALSRPSEQAVEAAKRIRMLAAPIANDADKP